MLKPETTTQAKPLPDKKPFDVLDFASRYVLISLLMGSLLFALLLPVGFQLSRPSYESSAMLRINPVVPSLITKSEDPSIINYFGNFARTQVKRLEEYSVLSAALMALDPEERAALFPKHLDHDQSVSILRARLQVKHLSRTHLLQLSMQDGKPFVIPKLLNQVMDAYLAKLRHEMEEKNSKRLKYLETKRSDLLDTITAKEAVLRDMAGTIMTSSFSEDFNLNHHRAQWLQKAYVSQLSDRILKGNIHLEKLEESAAWAELSLEPMVAEIVMNDQSIDFTSSWTYQELQKMRASLDGVTPQNTDRIHIEQRMQAMRDYEKQLLNETHQQADAILEGKREYDIARGILKSQADFEAADQATDELAAELAKAKAGSSAISRELIKAAGMKSELGFHRDLLFRIDTRIHELKAEAKAPLRVQVESIAREPKSPVSTNRKKLVLAIALVSYGAFFGLFVLVAFFDNRIRNLNHFQQALGPVVTRPVPLTNGLVPYMSFGEAEYDSAIHSLAGRLWDEHRQFATKRLIFTGVDSQVGVTCLTHNTATALSQMGLKVLLVNTVMYSRHPNWEILENLDGAVLKTHEGLDYLGFEGSDPRSTLPAHLETLSANYDLICLDCQPIRFSDQTERWAMHADGAVVIAQGDRSRFRDLKEAVSILTSVGIKSIAPVLNLGGKQTAPPIDRILNFLPRSLRQLPLPVQ